MRDVFPETFDKVDYGNLESAVHKIEERLRYSEECLDYAVRETVKAVEKGGTSPAEIVMRLYEAESTLADVKNQVQNMRVTMNRIEAAERQQQILTGTIPPLASTVGVVGQLYIDTYADDLYYCSAAGLYYTWHKIN